MSLALTVILLIRKKCSVYGAIALGLTVFMGLFLLDTAVGIRYLGIMKHAAGHDLTLDFSRMFQIAKQMYDEGIELALVKGQGIAQCYARPLWRSAGDVDFLLDKENYQKAKALLIPIAVNTEREDIDRRHIGLTIDDWVVELHGTLRSNLSYRINDTTDSIQEDLFSHKRFRHWQNDTVDISLPEPNRDALLVFLHILQHFFQGGIGLRQVCDWVRLLWVYRGDIDEFFLIKHLEEMRITEEWKVFCSIAVSYLGMPIDSCPLYSNSQRVQKKAEMALNYILDAGNFGNNRDKAYIGKQPMIIRRMISLWRQTKDSLFLFRVFPQDALLFWISFVRRRIMTRGLKTK